MLRAYSGSTGMIIPKPSTTTRMAKRIPTERFLGFTTNPAIARQWANTGQGEILRMRTLCRTRDYRRPEGVCQKRGRSNTENRGRQVPLIRTPFRLSECHPT